jgi:hypothetical protein
MVNALSILKQLLGTFLAVADVAVPGVDFGR